MVIKVEKHIIKKKNKLWRYCDDLCFKSKNLYNYANYIPKDKGIEVITTEESYTSGCSFLDNEEICKDSYNKSRRIKRGLFKSNKGVIINADVNGAYNIIKKVFPNAFADGIEGVDLHPIRVTI